MMNQIRFFLSLSAESYVRHYQGTARAVSVVGVDGRRLEFPAEHLRRFVTHDGVYGEFLLTFDANNKFVSLERVGDLPGASNN